MKSNKMPAAESDMLVIPFMGCLTLSEMKMLLPKVFITGLVKNPNDKDAVMALHGPDSDFILSIDSLLDIVLEKSDFSQEE